MGESKTVVVFTDEHGMTRRVMVDDDDIEVVYSDKSAARALINEVHEHSPNADLFNKMLPS